jgi:hypothetical protein
MAEGGEAKRPGCRAGRTLRHARWADRLVARYPAAQLDLNDSDAGSVGFALARATESHSEPSGSNFGLVIFDLSLHMVDKSKIIGCAMPTGISYWLTRHVGSCST